MLAIAQSTEWRRKLESSCRGAGQRYLATDQQVDCPRDSVTTRIINSLNIIQNDVCVFFASQYLFPLPSSFLEDPNLIQVTIPLPFSICDQEKFHIHNRSRSLLANHSHPLPIIGLRTHLCTAFSYRLQLVQE